MAKIIDPLERPVYLTPEALRRWIPALYQAGKQYKFYKTPEWQRLRREVMEVNHYECEDCRAMVPSRITTATTVHHDKETRTHPELALSRYWIDEHGRKHQQLFCLCDDCHNRRHERFGYPSAPEQVTEERW